MTGSGKQTDPYIIMNYADLCNVKGGSTSYFKLGADIDLSQTDRSPSAGAIYMTCKDFDGDGHTISNFFGRMDSSSSYNTVFSMPASIVTTLRNVNFSGIYLAGGITGLIDRSGTNTAINIINCRISAKINDTQNSATITPFFQKTVLTDSEVLIEGTSDYTKQITSKSASGCLIKLNLTFFNKDSASERLILGGTTTCCGITGKITSPNVSGANYKLTENTTSNSYFALNFDNISSFSMNSNLTGVNFYDKEVMSNTVELMPSAVNLYALTTEQCKSAEYLQSIDFPCVSGDLV